MYLKRSPLQIEIAAEKCSHLFNLFSSASLPSLSCNSNTWLTAPLAGFTLSLHVTAAQRPPSSLAPHRLSGVTRALAAKALLHLTGYLCSPSLPILDAIKTESEI